MASNVDFDTDKDFDFQFELGLIPDFELPADQQLTLNRPQVSLDDATLAETHDQIARQFGETTNPDVSEADDYLFGKLKKAEAEGEGQTVLLPINKLKNGQEQLHRCKTRRHHHLRPEQCVWGRYQCYHPHFAGLSREDAATVEGNYELAVEKINRTAAPENSQELYDKVFGPETVSSQEEYEQKIRETIQQNYDRESEHMLNRRIMDATIDARRCACRPSFSRSGWCGPMKANSTQLP